MAATRFGDRASFAVEVGEARSSALRIVDLWAAGTLLTERDNEVYVPSFCYHARSCAADVRRRDVRPCPFPERTPEEIHRLLHADDTEFSQQFWFLDWNEILDSVAEYAYLDEDDLVIVFVLRQPNPDGLGEVFVARIAPDEFAATLEQAADLLEAG